MKENYLDNLRAMSIIGVVIIHIASPLMNMNYNQNWEYWWIGNFFNSITRFAVPVFLMLSGATLFGRSESYFEFIKKRYSRILFPFVFWIPFYYIFRWWALNDSHKLKFQDNIWEWISTIFISEGISKHFWYIYMILFLYPFLPFVSNYFKKTKKKSLIIILLIWLIITQISLSNNLNPYNWSGKYIEKFTGYLYYLGYIIWGYFLKTIIINQKQLKFILILFFLSILVPFCGSYLMSVHSGKQNLQLYSYLHLNTIVQSISIFIVFKKINITNTYFTRIIQTLSKYSYGIYIVHIMVLGILWNNGIYWRIAYPLFSVAILTIIAILIPISVLFVLDKIPFFKKITGIK